MKSRTHVEPREPMKAENAKKHETRTRRIDKAVTVLLVEPLHVIVPMFG
jgi:hypothetical protein